MKPTLRAVPLQAGFLALALLLVPLSTAEAQERRVLDKDSFMQMERVSSPAISPDGSSIVFTRTWVDRMQDRYSSNLWITDHQGRRIRQLTEGVWRDSSPVWSPDGERIAFLSDRSGSTQLHVLWLDTREVTRLTRLERSPGSITWSPDGTQIAFTMFVPKSEPLLPVRLPDRPRGAQWAPPATVIDRLAWARDGSGLRPVGFTHLFTLDATLGGNPRQVTEGDYDHSGPAWSADGRRIYFSAIRKEDAEYLRGDSEIYAVDLETLEIEELTNREGPDSGPLVSPDGRWIAYTGHDQRNYTSHIRSLYLMDSEGGGKRAWVEDLPMSPRDIAWAADSSGIYYNVGHEGSYNIHFAPRNGSPRAVTEGTHTLGGFTLAENGRAAAVRSTFQEPGHLVTFEVRNSRSMRTLVDVNQDVLADVQLAEVEELWYTSSDGLRVQGWLVKPVDFDPEKKYPMVLWIHGGPWSMYDVGFSWPWQEFAAQGYAVLYTNPRGSTGYGQAFVNGIQHSYPGKDYDDLMAGVDAALAKGWLDERNLFVCGGSGGGVLTAWIVGHTDRFRAASSMRPVINWHSFVGTTDGASWYHQFRSFPWEDPMEFALRSPLHYVANVTTPVLVMTGEEDLRTPIGQSEEYYRALKMLKKETLFIRMPEEPHGWRRPSHQLLQQLYLQAWFERYRVDD